MGNTKTVGWHPKSTLRECGGTTLHFVDTGPRSGPAVVLLHGYVMSSWSWRGTIDALGTSYRVIAPCLPGFGYSQKLGQDCRFESHIQCLNHLLDSLEINRCAVVGHSLGGALAMEWAHQEPTRIKKLVLIASAGHPWKLPRLLQRMPHLAAHRLIQMVLTRTVIRGVLKTFGYRDHRIVDAQYMERYMEALGGEGNAESALHTALELPRALERLHTIIPKLDVPVQLLWGEEDTIVPVKAGRWMERTLPNARLAIWDEIGHCPHEESPVRFNQFLRSVLSVRDREE